GIAADAGSGTFQLHPQGIQPVKSQVGANPFRFPAELAGQYPHNLFLNLVAHGEPILGDGSGDSFERCAAELHRRYPDPAVEDDDHRRLRRPALSSARVSSTNRSISASVYPWAARLWP